MIEAKGLTKRFHKQAVLNDFDFDLQPGLVTVLLGRNGAGKSTFLRLALGVLKADAGELRVAGLDPVRKPRAVREAVGYVPDRPDVYRWMTPRDLYRFLKPQYPTWNDDQVARTSEALGVPLTTPFSGLSRGEGMKAMLVAALAHQPPLLLLDEPFAGLDPVVREEVLRGVIGELRSCEHTVLCATHDLDVAARIADRVAILHEGRIAVHGTVEEVLDLEEEAARVPERMRVLLAGMTA